MVAAAEVVMVATAVSSKRGAAMARAGTKRTAMQQQQR